MINATLVELGRKEPVRAWRSAATSSWWRLALLPVLPTEILLLTLRFDTGRLDEQAGVWIWLVANSSLPLKAFLAAVAAALLFGGARLWRDGQRVVREQQLAASPWWFYLAAHAAAVLAFTVLTQGLFEGDLLAAHPGLWASAWFLLGLVTFGLWLAALVPPSLWPRLARAAAWPLLGACVLGPAAWGFGIATLHLWGPLGQATLGLVGVLLRLAGTEVVSDPQAMRIGTATFTVWIAPECSGYEGIGLIVVFLGAYLALFRRQLRFPHVLILFPAGVALIWLVNVVRIALLILIGSAGGEAVALGGFHSQAGWLAFNALALGFVALTTRVRFFRVDADTAEAARGSRRTLDPTVAYLAPWLTILAVSMILGAFTAGFDWFYPGRVVAAGAVLWLCRKAYGRWDGAWSWQAVALGVVVFGVWLLLAPKDLLAATGPPPAWTGATPAWATLWLGFRLVGSVLTVPLAEELAFRGYLTRRLGQRDFQQLPLGRMTVVSFVVSSVLFGLLHGRCWPAGIVAGLVFALALWRRGRLADAVVAHVTANALLCGYVLSTGRWLLWN
jgi:exosortase E/protease (VPEID-CTERM system)